MTALDYFVKANLYGLLFVGCYHLLLRRHTFFGLNRAYLLASAVLSLTLPLIRLPTETAAALPVPVGVMALPTAGVTSAPVETDWRLPGLVAYGLVTVSLLVRLLAQVVGVLRLIRRSPQRGYATHVRVQPNDPAVPTFSFFRYLVLNPADAGNDLIVRHELVHIRQGHSVDVLALAILRALFWACPALWLVDRALRRVHEFLADRATAVNETNESAEYVRFLVAYTFGVRPDRLTNGFFNPSLLKQRIGMLHQRATTRWALGKYALVLPLALGLLAMTTARQEIKTALTPFDEGLITVSGRVTDEDGKPLPGTSVMDGTRLMQTDERGQYRFTDLASPATLLFSRLGFEPVKRQVAKTTVLDISLRRTSEALPAAGATAGYKAIKPNLEMPLPTLPNSQTINGDVFTMVEQQPLFPGGLPALMAYVARTLRYPAEAQRANVQGHVFVQFVVSGEGQIGQLRVLKGLGSGCDEEAVRVVAQMPRWEPGRQHGKPVAVQYVLPIQFSLEKAEDKRTGQAEPTGKPTNVMIANSPNDRVARYNDVHPKAYATADSLLKGTRFQRTADARTAYWAADSNVKSLSTFRIRGRGPLGPLGEEPLYVVDDQEVSAETVKRMNPKTVASMQVLGKSAATAAYGEKGKYGVVIITTQKP